MARRVRRRGPSRLAAALVAAVMAVAAGTVGAAAPPALAGPPAPSVAVPPVAAPPVAVPPVAAPPVAVPSDPTALIEGNPKLDAELLVAAGVPGSEPGATGDVPRYDGDRVSVVVDGPDPAAAVAAAGGEVIAEAGGSIAAYVPAESLAALAESGSVAAVRAPSLAEPLGATNEAIARSGATAWHQAGQGGDGVVVAVVDIGFGSLAQLTGSGALPEGLAVSSNQCGTSVGSSSHGTAVAEIVHQLAPGAQLALYCIKDSSQFRLAAQSIAAAGIRIAVSSLAFPGDSRGDGLTEDPLSAAATVRYANGAAGILWIQSAGNSGDSHFAGVLSGAASQEIDRVTGMAFANSIAVEWDQWSTAPAKVQVCRSIEGSAAPEVCSPPISGAAGQAPRTTVSLPAAPGKQYVIRLRVPAVAGLAGLRFDATYAYGSWNGVVSAAAGDPAAALGSITSPASSPYALAVGAIDVRTGLREQFSSQGPTIDGRVKPDLAGFDNTSSSVGAYSPFLGTSAAAPSVAGVAALLLAATPSLDAEGLKAQLLARAGGGAPAAPTNQTGAGPVSVGSPSSQPPPAPISSRFTALDPVRIRDTRYGPVASGPLGRGQEITVDAAPYGVPANATAVVINLTGDGATAATVLAAYPSLFTGTSNLNLAPGDTTAAASATVPVVDGAFRVRNTNGAVDVIVDLLGYYAPASGAGFTAVAPARIVDTRTPLNPAGAPRAVAPREAMTVQITGRAGVPPGATAVVINLTATNIPAGASGYVSVYPTAFTDFSTLNYLGFDRANLAVVRLDPLGRIQVQNAPTGAGAPIDLIVDVLGYYSAGGGAFVPRTPNRIVDTRISVGLPAGSYALDGAVSGFDRDWIPGIPSSPAPGASALLLNVTAVAAGSGFLSVYRGQGAAPEASTVNFTAGRIVPNATVASLDAGGYFSIYGRGFGTDVVVDVFGYFL